MRRRKVDPELLERAHRSMREQRERRKKQACGHLWVISNVGNVKICVECGERAAAYPEKR